MIWLYRGANPTSLVALPGSFPINFAQSLRRAHFPQAQYNSRAMTKLYSMHSFFEIYGGKSSKEYTFLFLTDGLNWKSLNWTLIIMPKICFMSNIWYLKENVISLLYFDFFRFCCVFRPKILYISKISPKHPINLWKFKLSQNGQNLAN